LKWLNPFCRRDQSVRYYYACSHTGCPHPKTKLADFRYGTFTPYPYSQGPDRISEDEGTNGTVKAEITRLRLRYSLATSATFVAVKEGKTEAIVIGQGDGRGYGGLELLSGDFPEGPPQLTLIQVVGSSRSP
jgi:hypothetical protein